MTEQEIWSIATAGDGSFDPVLAQQLGMPLKEFVAERERKQAQAAADQAQQEELNRKRSTGSTGETPRDRTGETEVFSPATDWQSMEEAYSNSETPIDGQEVLPGFETQEEATRPAPLNAETIKFNIGRVSFKVEFLKNPEDALIAWGAPPETLQRYLKKHYLDLVQIAADEMLADPRQIADKEKRTPEQMQKLNEVAARESIARFDLFFKTRWYKALAALDGVQAQFTTTAAGPNGEPADFLPLEAQAALYFFAIHEDIMPTAPADLTEEQRKELFDIFAAIDSFYCDYERKQGRPLTADELPGMLNAFIENRHTPQQSKFFKAEEKGAVSSIGDRLYVPTDPEYQNVFITSTRASTGFYRKDDTGNRQLALDVNTAFLQALAKSVWVNILNGKQGDTEVYFPSFARELGLDLNWKTSPGKNTAPQEPQQLISRAEAREIFINKKLAEWDNIWGVLPRSKTEYKLMALHSYNPETEVFSFQSPYLQEYFNRQIEKEEEKINAGDRFYYWQSDLLHATAANERNPAAVEMATRILQGVQQRGLKPDAKLKQNKDRAFKDETEVTFSITCRGLINDCPQIREKLNSKPTASRKTQELRRTFPAMYRILKEKTDLFAYYKDLTITQVIPTAKSLDATIIVKHHGGNPNYQKPFIPATETPEE